MVVLLFDTPHLSSPDPATISSCSLWFYGISANHMIAGLIKFLLAPFAIVSFVPFTQMQHYCVNF